MVHGAGSPSQARTNASVSASAPTQATLAAVRTAPEERVREEFLAAQGERLEAADIERFAVLLDLPDPTLYAYIVGRSAPDDPSIDRE